MKTNRIASVLGCIIACSLVAACGGGDTVSGGTEGGGAGTGGSVAGGSGSTPGTGNTSPNGMLNQGAPGDNSAGIMPGDQVNGDNLATVDLASSDLTGVQGTNLDSCPAALPPGWQCLDLPSTGLTGSSPKSVGELRLRKSPHLMI